MKGTKAAGWLYFAVHLLLETTSFFILTTYMDSVYAWLLMLGYDFIAFVPQGLVGFLRDSGARINFAFLGTAVTTLALVLMHFQLHPLLVVAVLSVGNCMVHIQGAEVTLRGANGKIMPAAVFVAGGSFGIIAGKLLAGCGAPVPLVTGLNLLALVPIFIVELKPRTAQPPSKDFDFCARGVRTGVIVALAVFVVAVRAYMGYGIPTLWNTTTLHAALLYGCMGLGKALGGLLTDVLGIRKTVIISTLGAAPFLLLGAEIMPVSLVGITLFSMTMAVTLALLVAALRGYPGVAFGCTTVGLFLGTLPMFFFRIHSLTINCILVSALSVVSFFGLFFICKKRSDDK